MKPNKRATGSSKGVTLIELIFVVLLFSVVTYTMWRVFITGTRTSTRLTQSVTLAASARMCDTKIIRELRSSVEILSPVEILDTGAKSSPILVILNELNELIVFFVNKKGELIKQNRVKDNEEEVLGKNVSAFRVFRKGRRLVNYHLELSVDDPKGPDGKRKFSLISSVTIRNNFN